MPRGNKEDLSFLMPWTNKEIWLALRHVCCSTHPPSDAKVIVMMREEDLTAAIRLVREWKLAEKRKPTTNT